MKATHKLVLGISGFLGAMLLNVNSATAASHTSQDLAFNINTNQTAIIGGVLAQSNSYIAETVVSIYDESQDVLCSGVLLTDSIVVTAAHCLSQNPEDMVVVFGLEFANSIQLKVDKAQPSPYWGTSNDIPGDIALVHFVGPLPAGFKAANMVTSTGFLQIGTPVIVAGYGIDNEAAKTGAGILRVANAKIANPTYDQTQIEVNQSTGSGACEGDSGGPGFVQISGKYYLWGITNGGVHPSCHDVSIYTNIAFYVPWIQNTAAKLSTSVTSLVSRY